VLDREYGYVFQIRERLERGVTSTPLSGPQCSGWVRYSSDRGFLEGCAYSHGFLGCLGVRSVGVVIPPFGWNSPGYIAGRRSVACVSGPRSNVWAGIAGRVGRGLLGGGVKRPPNRPPLEGGVGKNNICPGGRWQAAWIDGLKIFWIRSWQINVFPPLALTMKTNSTDHFAG